MARLLILQTGNAMPDIRSQYGDFDDWFRRALGLPDEQLQIVSVHQGRPLPALPACSAVVVTGSAAMVTDRADWSVRAADWLRRAHQWGMPILGVCYGHQLLAEALGGRVDWNERGRQMGTQALELHPAAVDDPLLGELESGVPIQVSHSQIVSELPPQAVLLARTAADPHHAYRIGDRTWGLQFHPEWSSEVMRAYLSTRADALRSEGQDPEALLAGVGESPADAVLRRFADLIR